MDRRERLFDKWDQRKVKLFEAYLRTEGDTIHEEVLRREFGVKVRDAELFDEWFEQALSASKEQANRETGYHEAGHAILGELLFPGSVVRAVHFRGDGPEDGTGFTEHDLDKLDSFGFGMSGQPLSLSICYAARLLAGGFFSLRLGGGSQVRAHREALGDRQHIGLFFEYQGLDLPQQRRCRELAKDTLSRLGSCDAVCRAVEAVAQVLIRDGEICGDEIRSIISREVGSTEELLFSLSIPRVEPALSAKAA
jgi:hypothetical protein